MVKVRHLFVILLLALAPQGLKAQDDVLKVGLRAGSNAAFGGFVATSLETNQTFGEDFSIHGAVQHDWESGLGGTSHLYQESRLGKALG